MSHAAYMCVVDGRTRYSYRPTRSELVAFMTREWFDLESPSFRSEMIMKKTSSNCKLRLLWVGYIGNYVTQDHKMFVLYCLTLPESTNWQNCIKIIVNLLIIFTVGLSGLSQTMARLRVYVQTPMSSKLHQHFTYYCYNWLASTAVR